MSTASVVRRERCYSPPVVVRVSSVEPRRVGMWLKFGLPMVVLLAGGVSVIYSATIAAVGRLLGCPIWSPVLAYGEALPLLALLAWSRWLAHGGVGGLGWRDLVVYIRSGSPIRIFILFGGVLGALIGMAAAYVPPVIGMGAFFVLFVTGQILAALLMDSTGLMWAKMLPPSRIGISANCMVVLGAIVFQWKSLAAGWRSVGLALVACVPVTIMAGVFAVVQGGLNAKLTNFLILSARTALWSFASGLAVLLCVASAVCPNPNFKALATLEFRTEWWKAVGGLLSVSSLYTMLVMPKFLGFAATTCYMVAGELIVSLIVDHFGLMELATRRVDTVRLFGISIVLLGVVLVQLIRQQQINITPNTPKRDSCCSTEVCTPSFS